MRVTSQIPPTSPQIAFVGEAPGEEEAFRGIPFVGASGRFLHHTLKALNINPQECYIGNVFSERPPQNDVSHFFIKKSLYKKLHKEPSLYPPCGARGYINPIQHTDMSRLRNELESAHPNLVVALGATALWALTGQSKIGAYRGTTLPSTLIPGLKVLPTYHPAYILRNYQDRSIFNADLLKAKTEAQYPKIRIPERTIHVAETLADLHTFEKDHLTSSPQALAIDVETSMTHGILLCLSIAPSPRHALVIPITKRTTHPYWPKSELPKVLAWLNHIFSLPSIKVGQNFLFDISWLAKYNLFIKEPLHDTMLLHHALQPELPKDLGTLGSIYCNCPAWKQMSPWKKKELAKVEE